MNRFVTLIKREFWEHRSTVFFAPLIISVVLILFMLSFRVSEMTFAEAIEDFGFGLSLGTMPAILWFVIPLMIVNYALNSLYEERKNKAIFFWRSMPVSDTQTVLSKVFFGVIVVPIMFILAWFATMFVSVLLTESIEVILGVSSKSDKTFWQAIQFIFGLFFAIAAGFLTLSILMLPYYAYLTFVSSIGKRSPVLIAILPFIALGFASNFLHQELLAIYQYLFMPGELAVKAALNVFSATFEATGALHMIADVGEFRVKDFYDLFNRENPISQKDGLLTKDFGMRELYVAVASIIVSVAFITLSIFARKRIHSA